MPVLERLALAPVSAAQAEAELTAALRQIGQRALQAVLQQQVDRADAARVTPAGYVSEGPRARWVRSVWGDFRLTRQYYRQVAGGPGLAPADAELGLWQGYTPRLAALLTELAAALPYEHAARLLEHTTGANLTGQQFLRVVNTAASAARQWLAAQPLPPPSAVAPERLYVSYDGTGVPMRRAYLADRRGRDDAPPKTREVRLGCVFTQTTTDTHGEPLRDPASTTYLASFDDVQRFGRAVRAEAFRRGWRHARQRIVLTDGATCYATLAAREFAGYDYVYILDFFHAAEHLAELTRALWGDTPQAQTTFRQWRRLLRRGRVAEVIAAAAPLAATARNPATVATDLGFFRRNHDRMHYDQYRRAGLFIGSGVVEAGCKTLIGQRTKLSGMHWGIPGAENLLLFRCLLYSHRLDGFWAAALPSSRAA